MTVTYRDLKLKREKEISSKVDKQNPLKAVIVDENGNSSGSGNIWADRNARRVWIQLAGSASISQVPCYTVKPVIGLGVLVGYFPWSNIRQVLSTDMDFLGTTNPTGTSYESPDNEDMLPGGRLQLWIASKMLEPLATYPDATGLTVNVVEGDYTYAGTRKTFSGQTGIALTQNPNPGEHYYAGLYLDSSNALQVIYGASVSTATTPTEPVWPSGAFRLSVVRINDTQTSITFTLDTDATNDVLDRRLLWSDSNILGVPLAGAIITGNATPEWVVLPPGEVGQYVTKNTSGILEWRDIPTVGITEFLYDLASDIATYFQLKTDIPTGGAQTIVSAAVLASDTLIFNLATNAGGPGVDFINDGVWHLHLHAQKSGPGTKNVTLKFRVYYRTDPGGVETQIGTGYSESTGNLTTSAAEYNLHLALDELTIDITDRIVLKIYADISGAGTNPTVTLTVEGTTDSRLEIPALVSGTGGSKGWPTAGKAMINNTEYDTVQLAEDAAASGDIIKVGQGTDSGETILDTAGSVVGLSAIDTILTRSDNDNATLYIGTADNTTVKDLTVANTGAGTFAACVQTNQDNITFDGVIIQKISGAPTNAFGINVFGGNGVGTLIRNCKITVSAGTNKYGVYCDTAASNVIIEGGEIDGDTADIYIGHASAVVELRGPKLLGGGINNASGGTVRGWYIDAYGRTVRIEPIKINNARLTLTSGTPVTTADVTAATEIYVTPYEGNTVELFNGVGWIEANHTEKSIKTTDTQTGNTHNGTMVIDGLTDTSQLIVGMEISGTGVGAASTIASIDSATQVTGTVNSTADGTVNITFKIPASKNVDIFMFDNAGTPKLEFSPLWTDATTRATALTTQDGRYVKNGATTRLYLGTVCTTTTAGQCEDSVTSRLVWNYYNRVAKSLHRYYGAIHTYNTATWRAFNNSAANAQVDCVLGVLEDAFSITCAEAITFTAGDSTPYMSFGLNTTAGASTLATLWAIVGTNHQWTNADLFGRVGYNFICPVEFTPGGGNAPTWIESQIDCRVKC